MWTSYIRQIQLRNTLPRLRVSIDVSSDCVAQSTENICRRQVLLHVLPVRINDHQVILILTVTANVRRMKLNCALVYIPETAN